MQLKEQVYAAYRDHINSHMEDNRLGALTIKEELEHSPLYWQGILDKTVHIPKIFDEETIEHFRQIVDVSYSIFGKVIRQYRESESYRRLFPFPRELEELILLPPRYDCPLPIARIDIFYHEDTGDFQLCEINTDGTAAMIRDYELRKALIHNPAHQSVIKKYDLVPFELFDSWVRAFLSIYSTYHKKKEHPYVAIVDILENATFKEFEKFAEAFTDAGIDCEICDIRSLKYRDGILYSPEGHPIDAVYRRAVTADIMAHYTEVTDFLDAVRDDAVFVAGSFATQLIHTKWLFYVLHHPDTKAILTDEEYHFVLKHVPRTVELSEKYISLDEVLKNKDQYIIKPMDAYASKGIYASGRECSPTEWEKVVKDLYGKGYICQEYCSQYLTDNIDFAWGDGQWHPYINMPGLYVYNGSFAGILMRAACEEKIITAHENERTLPVFTVMEREDILKRNLQ